MNQVGRAFEQHNRHTPFDPTPARAAEQDVVRAWSKVRNGEIPPMMFQLRFGDGRMISFAYSDIREIHCANAGLVEVFLHSIQKTRVTIEGRHLQELANLLGNAMLRFIRESDQRAPPTLEQVSEVTKILVEPL